MLAPIFLERLKTTDLEDPFLHPVMQDTSSFYARVGFSENCQNQLEKYLFRRLGWPEPPRKMDLQDPFFSEGQATLTNETNTFHLY